MIVRVDWLADVDWNMLLFSSILFVGVGGDVWLGGTTGTFDSLLRVTGVCVGGSCRSESDTGRWECRALS